MMANLHAAAEYNIMRPPEPKQEAAAAFISNCNSRSFRLAALEQLSELLPVHSFGLCLRSNQTQERKVDVLRRYHFALAFENSQVGAGVMSLLAPLPEIWHYTRVQHAHAMLPWPSGSLWRTSMRMHRCQGHAAAE